MTHFPLPDNTTTEYAGIMVWANDTVNGVMGWGILLIVMSVVFFGTKRFGATTAQAFLAGTTTTMMVCGALTIMSVTSAVTFLIVLMLWMFSYIYSYHE